MSGHIRISRLEHFVAAVLVRLGVPEAHAVTTAQRLVEADIRGIGSHGVFRLPGYVRRIQAGGYNLDPTVRVVHSTPVSAVVDGDNALGQVVMTMAAELAREKAVEHGLCWVGVRNSNHAGAAGIYASMALEADLIGIYMAIGNANHLPPWGGVDMLLSTNPLAVAIPAGDEPPIVLDMATTVASYGRVKVLAQRGEPLPTGWMVDRAGQPLTDSARIAEGFLMPIGGYKGYGLNLVIGALAGVLNGAAVGSATIDFNADFTSTTNTGHTIIMVRPDLFRPLAEFKREMDLRIGEIKRSTPSVATSPIRVPGDQLRDRTARAEAQGVALDDETVANLDRLADAIGVDRLVVDQERP
jgi:L-2-hydroxycarboxylate dehydrogenase (NAD+)